jgi:hypothetical protein
MLFEKLSLQQGSGVRIHAVWEPATAAGAAIFRASPGGQKQLKVEGWNYFRCMPLESKLSKRVLKSELFKSEFSKASYSKASSRKRVLESNFAKAISRKRFLDSMFSKAISQKQFLEPSYWGPQYHGWYRCQYFRWRQNSTDLNFQHFFRQLSLKMFGRQRWTLFADFLLTR